MHIILCNMLGSITASDMMILSVLIGFDLSGRCGKKAHCKHDTCAKHSFLVLRSTFSEDGTPFTVQEALQMMLDE